MNADNKVACKFLFSQANTCQTSNGNMERIDKLLSILCAWKPIWANIDLQPVGNYNLLDNTQSKRTLIHPDILEMCKLFKDNQSSEFAIVKYADGHYAAEVRNLQGEYYFCEYSSDNGQVHMSKLVDEINQDFGTVSLKIKERFEFTALFLCLFGALQDKGLWEQHPELPALDDDPEAAIAMYSETIEQVVRTGVLPVTLASTGSIRMFRKETILDQIGELMLGSPKFLNIGKTADPETAVYTIAELRSEFEEFRATGWSDEEQALVPVFADDFPCVPEVRKILKAYTRTLDKPNRLVNFQWTGTSGYGKSTGVKNIANILNMPLLIQTCNPNTETEDFQSTFVPNTEKKDAISIPVLTQEDMEFDPEGCWEQITGEIPEGEITGFEVALRYAEEVRKSTAHNASDSSAFNFVLANYTKALEKGYIVEVQESSRIQRQGVLVGLNETALPGAVLPHIDGTHGTRHPNAIVIYTDNEGLDTCQSQDDSVISRFSFKLISEQPSKEFILARLKTATGVKNEEILEQAYSGWETVNAFCTEKMISNGAGVRELTNLVTMLDIEGAESFTENLRCCVINKVVPEKEDRLELETRLSVIPEEI